MLRKGFELLWLGMRVIRSAESILAEVEAMKAEKAEYLSGKIRIGFSQSRGAWAVFVSNRMVGQSFDSASDAKDYLMNKHGIEA